MNRCALPPRPPPAHVSDIYACIWLGVRNRYWLFVWKVLLSGKFWFLCSCCAVPTWYSSWISWIIFVEKKYSCWKISAFHVWQLWGNWKKISAKHSTNCDSLTVFDLYNSSALSKWSWCVFESCRIHRQDQWKCRAKDRLNLPIWGHNNCGPSHWWAKPSDALDGADQDVIFVNATGSMQPPGDVIM